MNEPDFDTIEDAPPPIGDNNPPPDRDPNIPDEYYDGRATIEDYYAEAKHWLDGEPVSNETMAESIGLLVDRLRKASKKFEDAFKKEKGPITAAGKAVDARYNETRPKVKLAIETAQKALAPWLEIKRKEKEAEDARLRKIAMEAEAEAIAAARAAQQAKDDLEAQEKADRLAREAKITKVVANKAQRQSAGVKVAGGRTISERTRKIAKLVDPEAALEHFWPNAEIEELLTRLGQAEVNMSKPRVPGFNIVEERKAV